MTAGSTGGVEIVVHGGAGGSSADRDGCETAARNGLDAMLGGGDSMAAAVAAVLVMENDERFNAGTGSVLCLDGSTIEMDAAVMDTRGRLGAVACIQRVRNPVLVAQALTFTPHWLLCGEGAERFARTRGYEEYLPMTDKARARHREMMERMTAPAPVSPGVANDAFFRFWNYAEPPSSAPCDTVGAVVRDAEGHFAVAGSTGGAAPSLLGRVGDTPIIGSGFYAGPHGAVAATGIGEHIVRHLLAHRVYGWIADGVPLAQALQRGVELFDANIDIGLIAISQTESGAYSNRDMPWAKAGNEVSSTESRSQ